MRWRDLDTGKTQAVERAAALGLDHPAGETREAVSRENAAGKSCPSSQSSAPLSPANCLVSMSPVRATAFHATWRGESEAW